MFDERLVVIEESIDYSIWLFHYGDIIKETMKG
jgi:hypothetical protein